jgi:hypothetical protein
MSTRGVGSACFLLVLIAAGVASGELVGYWALDENSGTKAADSSGQGNDGTITGYPTWIAGVKGSALEFHGLGAAVGGGDSINCGSGAALDIRGPISISLWIKPGAEDPEGKGMETAPLAKAMNPNWSWQVRYGWGGAPKPYMSFTFNTSPRAWAFVGQKLTRDEWYHIACSYDGTTLKCYLNGEQTDSTPMGPIASSSTPVLIGSDGWGSDWIGAIDDVQIYSNALTADQIMAICPPSRLARSPDPPDGAVNVTTPLLQWKAGYKGFLHQVYVGTSPDLGPADAVGSRTKQLKVIYPSDFTPGATYYWRVDEIEADLTTVHQGNVWSFTAQDLIAYLPAPANAATAVSLAPTLSWQPGQNAVTHQVYFSGDPNAVAQGTASADKGEWELEETSFAPGPLDPVTTYYWRVDEIPPDGPPDVGPVWSFTTCLPVEEFESYTDKAGNEVFSTWIDGLDSQSSGSIVGLYPDAVNGTFCETTIVHGGSQSMPLEYNNVSTPFYSEARRDFAAAQDWTAGGVNTLVLYVQGKSGNWPAPLYVTLTDVSNHSASVTCPNTTAVTTSTWTEWVIPLSDVKDVNPAKIKTMCIGVGQRTGGTFSGRGRIYIDDIWLTKLSPGDTE